MNKIRIFPVTALIVGLLLAPAAFAGQALDSHKETESMQTHEQAPASSAQRDQGTVKPPAPTGLTVRSMPGDKAFFKANELIGSSVKNAQGEELGSIEELVINPQDGRVIYAVLSFGGFLGMGDKLFAIPWEALTPMPEGETFKLDVKKEKLAEAPGFDKNNWPDMANREWGTSVHKFYNQKPSWE
jgi:sporulation protein YlmC with PRC-barrel domain